MITQLGVISEISIMKYHSWNSIFCKRKTKKYISNVKDRGRSRAAATSKMECFVITIITKCSILDVAAVLDPSLKV